MLVKAWNRIYGQDCEDSSVILQNNSILTFHQLLQVFAVILVASQCEREIMEPEYISDLIRVS